MRSGVARELVGAVDGSAHAMKTKLTYVYCLVRGDKAPSMTRAPAPLPGMEKPRTVDAGKGLWLVVSDAPAELYGEEKLNEKLKELDWVSEAALAHERVIEHAVGKKGGLPLKLFTLFNDDGRAVSFVSSKRRQLEPVLDRLEGCAEFGVRLTLDEVRARQVAEAQAGVATAAPASGAAFLMRKKQVRDVSAELTRGAHAAASELFEELSGLARDARRRTEVEGLAPGSRLVMDGVFLVPNEAAAKFKTRVKSVSKTLYARGYDLALTGPWPPYHFV